MIAALEGVAFLANSENRVAVLEFLVEAPHDHDEIRDRIGASRVTTARILREFEARNWIARSGQECTVTPTGEWVCDEFTRLVDEMEAERRLREPLQWLPSDLLTFDVRRLRDAELVVLEESDATAIIRRILEFRRSGDRIRGLTRVVAHGVHRKRLEIDRPRGHAPRHGNYAGRPRRHPHPSDLREAVARDAR